MDFEKKNYLLLENFRHVNAELLETLQDSTLYQQYRFQQACKRFAKEMEIAFQEVIIAMNKIGAKGK